MTADLAFVNGVVYTVDAARSRAQAIAVEGGRISLVGSDVDVRGAIGPRTECEPACLFDQLADAGRVVDGAVVDLVALRIGQADAEVIPVSAVDHRLVGKFLPREDAHDVVRR